MKESLKKSKQPEDVDIVSSDASIAVNQPSQATMQRALLPVLFDHQSKTWSCTREPAFVSNWGSKWSVVSVGEGHRWSRQYGNEPPRPISLNFSEVHLE
jgi:hypothetical protein